MCPRTPRPGQGLQHTLYTLVYTAALALSSEPALLAWPVHCIGFLSLAVSRVRLRGGSELHWCVVLSCVPLRHPRWCGCPKDVPGRGRRRQLRYAVGVAPRRLPGARLALPPPFLAWGLGPLRQETSTATVATTRRRGRCYTRPCARAKGPSSFSAVRRQDWLDRTTTRQSPRGE